jgi:hypothetical protein
MVLGKLATAVLAVSIVISGISICPRGGLACSMPRAMGRCCCGSHAALRTTDCCAGGAHSPATTVKASSTDRDYRLSGKLLAPVAWQAVSGTSLADTLVSGRCYSRYGPAPPDTPITQHTLLLL